MPIALTSTPAPVTLSYRWVPRLTLPRDDNMRDWESDMPRQQPGRRARLAWALLALTVVLLVSGLVLGLTGGEGWTAVLGSIPVEAAFAGVGAPIAARTRKPPRG